MTRGAQLVRNVQRRYPNQFARRRIAMSLRTLTLALAAAFAAGPVSAQSAWEQYWSQLQQNRQMQSRRYDEWRRRQEQAYQQQRLPAEQAGRGDFRVELRDGGIPPGQYRLRLPFGLEARVQVQPPAVPQSGWGHGVYGQVFDLAQALGQDLRDVRYGIYQTQNPDLRQRVDATLAAAEQLRRGAAQREPDTALREQFREFDENWHRLAHALAAQEYLNASWIRRKAEAVSHRDEQLHQILQIGQAPVYDRLRVAALTRQLADATSHLLEDVEFEARDNPQAQLIHRRARRVQQLAEDLEYAAAQNASFTTIVEEYEQFDESWHRLIRLAQQTPGISDHLREAGRRVAVIDRELHRELMVESPVMSVDPAQMRNLAASVVRQAEHLVEDLHYVGGRRNQEAVRRAEMFASAARRLQQRLSQSPQELRRVAERTENAWTELHDALHGLRGRDAEHVQEMGRALEEDFDRLLEMIRRDR
jgi:hypothetical protein